MIYKDKHYLCLHLSVGAIAKIIPLWLFGKSRVFVYHMFENKTSRLLCKFKRHFLKGFLRRLSIEIMPFDVTKMKLEDGRSVIETCYYGTLNRLMEDVQKKCLDNKDSVFRHLSRKLLANKEEIKLWIKHYVAYSVIDQVLLVDIALWLLTQETSPLKGAEIGVVIDRKSYGSSFIIDYVRENKLELLTVRTAQGLKENLFIQFWYHLFNLLLNVFPAIYDTNKDNTNLNGKICAYHYGDCGFTDFQHKRNYSLFWYPESGLKPEDILIFSQKSNEIDEGDIFKAKQVGFDLIACDGFKRGASRLVRRHKCSIDSLKYFVRYCIEGIKLMFKAKNQYEAEIAKIKLLLLFKLPYWEDFFRTHNVKILFKPGALFSWIDIAAKISGCALISFQNSNIVQAAMGHFECCDVFFVWGKGYLNVYKHEHARVKNYLLSGYIFDHTFTRFRDNAIVMRKDFKEKEINFVISLFDENIAGKFVIGKRIQEGIINLYERIFQYVFNNKEIGLLVKPKLNSSIVILRVNSSIGKLIDCLEREGRVKFLDSSRYPAEAGLASDLAVGMVSNSTAALECSLAGVPSIAYNSDGAGFLNLKNDFKNEQLVYDEIDALIDAVDRFKNDRLLLSKYAGGKAFFKDKDPFCDGKTSYRIGCYINSVFTNMSKGLSKDQAINEANKIYTSFYGEDKVDSANDESVYVPQSEEQVVV